MQTILLKLSKYGKPKNPIPAILILTYLIIAWLGPAYLSKSASAYILIGWPLLAGALLRFSSTRTWSWIGSSIKFFTYWLFWRPALAIVGGRFKLILKLIKIYSDYKNNQVDGTEVKSNDVESFPAIADLPQTHISDPASNAAQPKADTSTTTDSEEKITLLNSKEARDRYVRWMQYVRPRSSHQIASLFIYSLMICIWLLPMFSANNNWVNTNRWWLLPSIPLATSILLAFIEHLDNYFDNWDFPFIRITAGLAFAPIYWTTATILYLTVLQPPAIERLLHRIPLISRAYYPIIGFLITSRRYFFYLSFTVLSTLTTLLFSGNPWITIVSFLLLVLIEWVRLIKQLSDVKFLGVSNLNNFSELISSAISNLNDEQSKEDMLRAQIYIHAMVVFSKQIMQSAKPTSSYLITVSLILIKHVLVIGTSLASIRYFYTTTNTTLEYSCHSNSIFELFANSFILLFGEVTFGDCGAFLALINLLGVASSFLLLGLGLTYLSGRAEAAYVKKYEQLENAVLAYENSEIPTKLNEQIEKFGEYGIRGIFGLII